MYTKIALDDLSLLLDNIPPNVDLPPSFLASNSADEFKFAASLVLLSETKQLDITSRFRRDADAYYIEAKRSTAVSISQILYWMYDVSVVLDGTRPWWFCLILSIS